MKQTENGSLPTVFLVDGSTGAGKSTLMEFLRREYAESISVGAKFTDRPRRVTDSDWEFHFVDLIPPHLVKYTYVSVGRHYALDIPALRKTLDSDCSYAVSCTDCDMIRLIRKEFPTVVVYVYRDISAPIVLSLLESREGASEGDISSRLLEAAYILRTYTENIGIYDYVLLNTGSVLDLEQQARAILRECGVPPIGLPSS